MLGDRQAGRRGDEGDGGRQVDRPRAVAAGAAAVGEEIIGPLETAGRRRAARGRRRSARRRSRPSPSARPASRRSPARRARPATRAAKSVSAWSWSSEWREQRRASRSASLKAGSSSGSRQASLCITIGPDGVDGPRKNPPFGRVLIFGESGSLGNPGHHGDRPSAAEAKLRHQSHACARAFAAVEAAGAQSRKRPEVMACP